MGRSVYGMLVEYRGLEIRFEFESSEKIINGKSFFLLYIKYIFLDMD